MVKMLSDVQGGTYEEKLQKVGLTTLTERRERGDAIETFKTLNGFNRVKKEKWFEIEEDDARPTRRNTTITDEGEQRRPNVLKEEASRLEIRQGRTNVEWHPGHGSTKKDD